MTKYQGKKTRHVNMLPVVGTAPDTPARRGVVEYATRYYGGWVDHRIETHGASADALWAWLRKPYSVMHPELKAAVKAMTGIDIERDVSHNRAGAYGPHPDKVRMDYLESLSIPITRANIDRDMARVGFAGKEG